MPYNDKSTALAVIASIASIATFTAALYYLEFPTLRRQQPPRSSKVKPRCFSSTSQPSLENFKGLTQRSTHEDEYPLAAAIQKRIPIYDCNAFDLGNADQLQLLQSELCHILICGPGVYVMKRFFTDLETIEAANKAYDAIIDIELNNEDGQKGDHFAPASANSRIWNSFSKHALQDPGSFTKYFSNPWFKIVCESYLGPAYRLTSQVNIVRPGGKPQMPHRDYHLGFQTDEDVLKWPKAVHAMTSLLTLQGAVAHTDMPLRSGPTRLLPYSQLFEEGYRSYRSPEFIEYFQKHYVALPLEKGDAIFFNPALFHAAGENCTKDFSRSVNLIQVSSAFGKPMESIDTLAVIEKTYDLALAKYRVEGMSIEVDALIRAVGEGYAFPTNLDYRPPAPGGQAPESEQDMLRRGLSEGWDKPRMMSELTLMRKASSAAERIAT